MGISLLVAAVTFTVLGFIGVEHRPASSASNGMIVWMFISAGICAVLGLAMFMQISYGNDHPWTKRPYRHQAPNGPASEGR